MDLLLLPLFLASIFIWCKAVYATSRHSQIGGLIVMLGILLALFGIIWPLVMWKVTGSIYAFGPPFVYLLFSVIFPFYLGETLVRTEANQPSRFALTVTHSLFLAVSLVFPIICAFYFLAPERITIQTVLGLKAYH